MKPILLAAAFSTALSATAFAQVGVAVEFSPEQERTFYSTVTRERIRTAPPAGFSVEVGGTVPADVELYEVPTTYEYAPARRYRYTVHNERVYVVDPGDRRVVRIIRR